MCIFRGAASGRGTPLPSYSDPVSCTLKEKVNATKLKKYWFIAYCLPKFGTVYERYKNAFNSFE